EAAVSRAKTRPRMKPNKQRPGTADGDTENEAVNHRPSTYERHLLRTPHLAGRIKREPDLFRKWQLADVGRLPDESVLVVDLIKTLAHLEELGWPIKFEDEKPVTFGGVC